MPETRPKAISSCHLSTQSMALALVTRMSLLKACLSNKWPFTIRCLMPVADKCTWTSRSQASDQLSKLQFAKELVYATRQACLHMLSWLPLMAPQESQQADEVRRRRMKWTSYASQQSLQPPWADACLLHKLCLLPRLLPLQKAAPWRKPQTGPSQPCGNHLWQPARYLQT